MFNALSDIIWLTRNRKRLAGMLKMSAEHIRSSNDLLQDSNVALEFYRAEVSRLRKEAEEDSLMLQAYANWCAAHGVTPSKKDLEHASGKRRQ